MMANIVSQTPETINGVPYIRTTYDDGSETLEINAPPPPKNYLQIALDKTQVAVGGTVTATVSVVDDAGNAVPVNGTYYCPIVRQADRAQKAFLTVALTNGTGTVSFSLPEPGVYTLDPETIRPVPTAELPGTVELIVT